MRSEVDWTRFVRPDAYRASVVSKWKEAADPYEEQGDDWQTLLAGSERNSASPP